MVYKRDAVYLIIISLLIAACAQSYYSFVYSPAAARDVKIYYSREIKADALVADTIIDAEKYVYFAIYTFTKPEIKDALLGAKAKGLEVKGVVDTEQTTKIDEQRKIVQELVDAGVTIYAEDNPAIMHLKTVVTDKAFVSGPFNWTKSATNSNDEVLEVGKDPELREQYKEVLEILFQKYQSKIKTKAE